MTLHLAEIRIDPRLARSWARDLGMSDCDDGYLAHSLTRAAYGDSGLQPFSLQPGGRDLRLLGYTKSSADDLQGIRSTTAEPSVDRCFVSEMTKKMPERVPAGTTFGFALRAAPTRRSSEKGERDAYLFDVERPRYQVYLEWLEQKLSVACEVLDSSVTAFTLMKCSRRSIEDGKAKRTVKPICLPDVTFKGRIRVSNPDRFMDLLNIGVGRHKAFGFGALLLRADGN